MTKLFAHFWLRKVSTVLVLLLTLFTTSHGMAAGVCDINGGSGIGGTGYPIPNSGLGGTGSPAINNGIGGTGKPLQKHGTGSGIGGTGQVAYNNGIGGTGQPVQQAGLIEGTITGFGSICVNGIEIHYTANTPLNIDGQPTKSHDALAIGQVVSVGVSGVGQEVTANKIHIVHAARGPISAIDFTNGQMIVMGQTVQLPPQVDPSSSFNGLQMGDFVSISGLRTAKGNIVASRVDKQPIRPAVPSVSLSGRVSSISGNSFSIQGMKINSPQAKSLSIGQSVQVTGRMAANHIKADNITLTQNLQPKVDQGGLVSVEGFLSNNRSRSSIEVGGKAIQVPASLREQTNKIPDFQKVIVTGRLDKENVIEMQQIIVEVPTIDTDRESKEHEIKATHSQKADVDNSDKIEKDERSSARDQRHEQAEKRSSSDEHETPEIPEVEIPEVHEHEYEAPEIPEVEIPEVHEHEYEAPEIPEIEIPEVHEHEYEAPEIPEIEIPEVHEHEYEAPEIPEVHEHEHEHHEH
jgi:hypothetical protein